MPGQDRRASKSCRPTACLAHEAFYNVSHGHQTYVEPTTEQAHTAEETGPPGHSMPGIKARKDQLKERRMTLADRLAFMEAKKKELESFFQNDVWEMVKDNGTVPQRPNSQGTLHPEVDKMAKR